MELERSEEVYQDIDFTEKGFVKGRYSECTFQGCNLAGLFLSGSSFSECVFVNCDLSNSNVVDASFKGVVFKDSKLLAFRFDECNPFMLSLAFDNCVLDFSSFFGVELKGTNFGASSLVQSDLSQGKFQDADFADCTFDQAVFDQTNLEKADFRGAKGYTIDPTNNYIRKAKFSYPEVLTLLNQFGIQVDY